MQQAQAIANAYNMMLAMLVTELDQRGLVSKANFAKLLRDTRQAALAHDPALDPDRADLVIFNNVADLLDQAEPWRPEVIDGGKTD